MPICNWKWSEVLSKEKTKTEIKYEANLKDEHSFTSLSLNIILIIACGVFLEPIDQISVRHTNKSNDQHAGSLGIQKGESLWVRWGLGIELCVILYIAAETRKQCLLDLSD